MAVSSRIHFKTCSLAIEAQILPSADVDRTAVEKIVIMDGLLRAQQIKRIERISLKTGKSKLTRQCAKESCRLEDMEVGVF
jgi:hypothetical protein